MADIMRIVRKGLSDRQRIKGDAIDLMGILRKRLSLKFLEKSSK